VQHKQIWLSVYQQLQEQIAKAKTEGRERFVFAATKDLEEAIEQLQIYHGITTKEADKITEQEQK